MRRSLRHWALPVIIIAILPINGFADQTVRLSTINWEPYTGKHLPQHGFFSELVIEAFARVNYRVDFQYSSWTRALHDALTGSVHGVIAVYWTEERAKSLYYTNVVWKVTAYFIALQGRSLTYDGRLSSLAGSSIGVLHKSATADELQAAGMATEVVFDHSQNVKKLLLGRLDAVLMPRSLFFYYLEQLDPTFERKPIIILKPPYKVYDMHVAFSKKRPKSEVLTVEFNRGLAQIQEDGTYAAILQKHHVVPEG